MAFKFSSLLYWVRVEGDRVDKLNSLYTLVLYLALSVLSALVEILGRPMICACPETHGNATCAHEDAESTCWRQKNYFLPANISRASEKSELEVTNGLYQWVPVILLLQAALTYLPNIPWRIISKWMNPKISDVLQEAKRFVKVADKEERAKIITFITDTIDSTDRYKSALIPAFLTTKCFNILALVIQLVLLDSQLAADDKFYGLRVILTLLQGREWLSSDSFPSNILCGFDMRNSGQIQNYVIQCSPFFNESYEKLFAIIWCWVLILLVVTSVNTVSWFIKLFHVSGNNYFKKLLLVSENQHINDADINNISIKIEVNLMIRLIASNVSATVSSGVVAELWRRRDMARQPTQGISREAEGEAEGTQSRSPNMGCFMGKFAGTGQMVNNSTTIVLPTQAINQEAEGEAEGTQSRSPNMGCFKGIFAGTGQMLNNSTTIVLPTPATNQEAEAEGTQSRSPNLVCSTGKFAGTGQMLNNSTTFASPAA